MRLWAAAMFLLPCVAFADRVIPVPMSVKVPLHEFKQGGLYRTSDKGYDAWLGYGLNRHVEIEFWTNNQGPDNRNVSGSVAYQLLPSFEDAAPGLAIGIQDLANASPRGRVAYLAFTMRMGNTGDYNQDVPTEFTFGLWSYDRGAVYFGAKLPITNEFWLIGEHDGLDLNWGVNLTVGHDTNLRFLFMRGRSTLGLTTRVAY